MSLLQKASIITTPTAYAEDYLYSIKPAYALGSELVTNGDFSTDSDWADASSTWSISGGKANCVVNASTRYFQQSNALPTSPAGKTFKVVYTISNYAQGALRISIGGYDTTTARLANGTYTEVLTVTNASSNLSIYLQANPNTIGSIDNLSVKEITDADFDFDRNSTGTRVNEDYLIEDVPYNLLSYTEDFTQWSNARTTDTANQIISPDGLNNGTLLEQQSGQTNAGSIYKAINTSGTYTLSVFAKKQNKNFIVLYDANAVRTYFNLNTGQTGTIGGGNTASISSAGNGWYRCSTTFTVSSGTVIAFYVGDNDNSSTVTDSGGVYIWGAQVVKGDQPKNYLKTTDRLDIPRIDYTNGEPSILLEPQRTNLVTYSESLTTYWTLQGVSLIADNTAINPTGNTFANKLNSLITGNFKSINRVETSAWDSKTFTMSCFAKKITNDYIFFYNIGSVSGINGLWFNISNGSIGTNGAAWSNAKIQNYGNGWYRCSAKITFGTSDNYLYISNSDGDNITSSTVGSQTYIWGTQVEEGSYETSYIPTSGSAVTRSADAANNAGNSDLISSTEGVFYVEIKALADDGTNRRLSLSDGSDTNRINLMYTATDNQLVINYKVAGTTQVSLNKVFEDVTEFHKVALRWESGNFAYYADGQEISTDSNTTMISANTLNTLRFEDPTGANDMYANIKMVAVFKEALTDLELEKLTGYNNHELYMNYYNRLSYLGLVEEYNVESDINNYIL